MVPLYHIRGPRLAQGLFTIARSIFLKPLFAPPWPSIPPKFYYYGPNSEELLAQSSIDIPILPEAIWS